MPSVARKLMARPWSASTFRALVSSGVRPYFAPLQPSITSIRSPKASVRYTLSTPAASIVTRSRPAPVSMLGSGSGSSDPSSSMLYCMNTRFQNSMNRSHSQSGPQSGRPQANSGPRS